MGNRLRFKNYTKEIVCIENLFNGPFCDEELVVQSKMPPNTATLGSTASQSHLLPFQHHKSLRIWNVKRAGLSPNKLAHELGLTVIGRATTETK